ncbi:nuclear transport factor 2 family protein, partial [Burkholderia multivorans]|nr:nuclear transport factor 2 family protein [Burkholderia multivorans]
MSAAMQRLIDKDQIRGVMLRYARGVDRRDWECVRSAFFEDCHDDHADFKGTRDAFIAW